jgi:hypothetical protein
MSMNNRQAIWKARIYHDKAVTEQIENDLQVMVAAIIGENRLDITESKDGFDQYPSCHHWEKKFCRCKAARYQGYIKPNGYVFYGDSKIDIYGKVIASIAGNKLYFPFSVLPDGSHKKEEEDAE